MKKPEVGRLGEELRDRVEHLYKSVNDPEITLPEMEWEELAYVSRESAKWLGLLLGSDNFFLADIFDSLEDKQRALVARHILLRMCVHAEDKIVKQSNYERRAERMKYGHNLEDL